MSGAASEAATITRRTVLSSSAVGIAAVAVGELAACGKASRRPRVHKIPLQARGGDVELLNHALDLEHKVIAAYTAATPLLSGHVQGAAKQFLGQELSHAGELAGLIKQAGGKSNKPQAGYDLGHPRSRTDILRLLHGLERAELTLYLSLIPQLTPGSVRAAIAAILANDAQHAAVLRLSLRLDPLPSAFVSGAQ